MSCLVLKGLILFAASIRLTDLTQLGNLELKCVTAVALMVTNLMVQTDTVELGQLHNVDMLPRLSFAAS